MPGKRTARVRGPRPAPEHEQEEGAPVTKSPRWESDEAEPMDPGRPHQAFVESEARKYWQDMVKVGSLAKPDRQELRTAAMPILIKCLQKRGWVRFLAPTVKAHMAVNVMHMRAVDRGELTGPPVPSPDHIDALLRYMKVTRLAPQPIPLPWHGAPKHPSIYYYIDPITKQPTPREDALIRAEYVRNPGDGMPVSRMTHIHPSDPYGQPPPEVVERKSGIYYRLSVERGEIKVSICYLFWPKPEKHREPGTMVMPLSDYEFTPHYFKPAWLESDEDEP